MLRWAIAVGLVGGLACAGKGDADVAPTQSATAGLLRVETGRPSAENQAAQDAHRSERDEILAVLQSSQPAAQACYAEGVGRNPSLYGDLVARVTIVGSGVVSDATITRTTLRDDRVTACVTTALLTLGFPAPSKDPLVVSYPYVFVSDQTPSEVVRALYIKYGFIDPADETSDDDERKSQTSGEDGWYEHW